jgi:hypothetical protein
MRLCKGCLLLMAASGVPLFADVINQSPTGLPNPASTITFDEVAVTPNALVTNQFASLGVTFGPGVFFDPFPGLFSTPSLGNFINGGGTTPTIVIDFTQVQTGAAFALVTSPNTTSIFTAMLSGNPVDSFSATTGTLINFYGFANESFDSISLSTGGNGALFDDLQLSVAPPSGSTAPEPASVFLLLAGCGAFLPFILRRRKSCRQSCE